MTWSSRTVHLETTLKVLNMPMALDAFYLVVNEMSKEKGFVRHNGTHYYHHLVDVTQKLFNFGIGGHFIHPSVAANYFEFLEWKKSINLVDEDIITSSLLHDFVEDVPDYDIHWIKNRYNDQVASMVGNLTKRKGIDYKIEENMLAYLFQNAEHVGSALIKVCDRMHNFATLEDAPIEKRYRQALETEKFFFDFFKLCRDKYPFYSYIFFEAKTQIEAYLWLIKQEYKMHLEIKKLKSEIKNLKSN